MVPVGRPKSGNEAMMARRPITKLLLCVVALAWANGALAQEPSCKLYKIRPPTLNVTQEPRGDASSIGVLDKSDVVCITRERTVGERVWGFVDHKLKAGQRQPVGGWANLGLLQPLSASEIATLRGMSTPAATRPAPAAPAPPAAAAAPTPAADEVPRFNEPITTGPPPVNGHSLEELVKGVPLFPPIEGLPEAVWKKPCSTCHKWDRQSLCEQGAVYVKNPKVAFRGSHPYGGPEKIAILEWTKAGCQ
jgi:hypothetical protein